MHDGLSVRQTEKIAPTFGTQLKKKPGSAPSTEQKARKDVDTIALEQDLTRHLGMKADIQPMQDGRGTISIQYRDLDQLDALLKKLKQN